MENFEDMDIDFQDQGLLGPDLGQTPLVFPPSPDLLPQTFTYPQVEGLVQSPTPSFGFAPQPPNGQEDFMLPLGVNSYADLDPLPIAAAPVPAPVASPAPLEFGWKKKTKGFSLPEQPDRPVPPPCEGPVKIIVKMPSVLPNPRGREIPGVNPGWTVGQLKQHLELQHILGGIPAAKQILHWASVPEAGIEAAVLLEDVNTLEEIGCVEGRPPTVFWLGRKLESLAGPASALVAAAAAAPAAGLDDVSGGVGPLENSCPMIPNPLEVRGGGVGAVGNAGPAVSRLAARRQRRAVSSGAVGSGAFGSREEELREKRERAKERRLRVRQQKQERQRQQQLNAVQPEGPNGMLTAAQSPVNLAGAQPVSLGNLAGGIDQDRGNDQDWLMWFPQQQNLQQQQTIQLQQQLLAQQQLEPQQVVIPAPLYSREDEIQFNLFTDYPDRWEREYGPFPPLP